MLLSYASLNPYSTGRYSTRNIDTNNESRVLQCLNPYSTGRYSTRLEKKNALKYSYMVLILIQLEDTLRD